MFNIKQTNHSNKLPFHISLTNCLVMVNIVVSKVLNIYLDQQWYQQRLQIHSFSLQKSYIWSTQLSNYAQFRASNFRKEIFIYLNAT
jgi:hypothetical protein